MNQEIKIEYYNEVNKNDIILPIKYYAKIYYPKLQRYSEIYNYFEDSLQRGIKRKIAELDFEWENNNFKMLDCILIDGIRQVQNRKLCQCVENECENLDKCIVDALEYSKYPDFFEKEYRFEYNSISKVLIVDFSLPPIDIYPRLKSYKMIQNDWKGYYVSDNQLNNIFESTSFQISLRTLFELFSADESNLIDSICFNGWVNAINRAIGKREKRCILSVQVEKHEFLQIDLAYVDPKICVKSLKGVFASRLFNITSVQPLVILNQDDKRFVDHHNVIEAIDSSTNLALIDWEEFEHLIREIFEKEFSANGGVVKVTQASRDGGVDAIAFDPDPIRGGKIVIQAKRYTNTVGVSSVRDLYGTILNEGATKGILVTTSDFGSDSYAFAKGKPITLLNGSNLLYLLEKHGQHARIDIQEAKLMQNK